MDIDTIIMYSASNSLTGRIVILHTDLQKD